MTSIWTVDPGSLHDSILLPPISKSDAQRALVLAHILNRPELVAFRTEQPEFLPADVLVIDRGLSKLRHASQTPVEIDCADGGAPFRLLLGQAAVTPGASVRFYGTPRLGERPHRPLFDALRLALGPSGLLLREGSPWPVELVAPRTTGEPRFRIAGAVSSQFVSSLLLAAAALVHRGHQAWTVEIESETASAGYLDLTIAWLERCGFQLTRSPKEIEVKGWQEPTTWPSVPGDWSSLGYLLLTAWKSGGRVARVDLDAAHPDRAIVRIVTEAGLCIDPVGDHEVRVRGKLHRGLKASGAECPDLLPTLAALACVAPEPSTFEAVDILRHKESDRLEGIIQLVQAAGGSTNLESGNRLSITPPAKVTDSLQIDSYGDHRLAMAAATLAILTGTPLRLQDPECVRKSFPDFWRQLEGTGVRIEGRS